MTETILLTGAGDLSFALTKKLSERYLVLNPNKLELDVSNVESVEKFFSRKKVDIVVNLAGTLHSATILESNIAKWVNDINVNLIGTYLISRFALTSNSKTKVINISSTAAFNSYADWSSYCASKAGVLKISNALALDGFEVVTLCPGAIETKLRDGLCIENPQIMSIDEGIKPIINAIEGEYDSGDIVFYRKKQFKILREI
jgi:3-oxoacyl-[acyl-carrier protein] reductase